MIRSYIPSLIALMTAALGCSSDGTVGSSPGGSAGSTSGGTGKDGTGASGNSNDDGCEAVEICGDNLDNDCDGQVDGGCPSGDCDDSLEPPRLIAPLSGSQMTTNQPEVKWESNGSAFVQWCEDRACTRVLDAQTVEGGTAKPSEPLTPGVNFWRVSAEKDGKIGCRASNPWTLQVGHGNPKVSAVWGSFADFNGDGHADLAVTAPGTEDAPSWLGATYIYLGTEDGLPATHDQLLENPAGSDGPSYGFGTSAAIASDLNGDGYGDLLIGAREFDNQDDDQRFGQDGRLFAYYGSSDGLDATPEELVMPKAPDTQFGGHERAWGAGDLNGDGYGDVLVSRFKVGHIYYGSADGFRSGPEAELDVEHALAAGCDVNADGFTDLLLGVSYGSKQGDAFVHLGGPDGVSQDRDLTIEDAKQDGAGIGQTAACAGDVNGDGYPDAAFGAIWAAGGRAILALGSESGPPRKSSHYIEGGPGLARRLAPAGDIDGDGFAEVAISYQPDNREPPDVWIGGWNDGSFEKEATIGSPGGTRFGWSRAVPADFGGDGIGDLVIADTGKSVYIFKGSTDGHPRVPAHTIFRLEDDTAFGGSIGSNSR